MTNDNQTAPLWPGFGGYPLPEEPPPPPPPSPVPVGSGLYRDPTTGVLLKLDETGGFVPATPAEIRAYEKSLAGGGAGADPVLLRLQQEAAQQGILTGASEEMRARAAFPTQLEEAQTTIESMRQQMETNERRMALEEQNLERQVLSDKFERAQDAFSAANLADQLATEKRKAAVAGLASLADFLVPSGMEFLPGTQQGVLSEYGPPIPLERTATVNLGELLQADPQADAALQYLLQAERQQR